MQDLDVAFKVSKALIKKVDGKTTFSVPNADQVSKIITSCDGFSKALQSSVTFTAGKVGSYPALKSMPIKQSDVDKLKSDLTKVKDLPFAA